MMMNSINVVTQGQIGHVKYLSLVYNFLSELLTYDWTRVDSFTWKISNTEVQIL